MVTVARMSKNGNAPAARAPLRGTRREPTTDRGRELQAYFLETRGMSIAAVAKATGLHFQSVRRAIHGEPGAQSVSTLDALLAFGVPPRLLDRAG